MIDTIVLILSSSMFRITHPERFSPSASWAENKSHWGAIQSKQNPTQKELLGGIYKPRLTLSHRMNVEGTHDLVLRIELSLPKFLFGNNFQELQYKDFAPISHTLISTLRSMGVEVTEHAIARAPICAIHYSKNIILTDGSTPYSYIRTIKEADISRSLDVNQTDYRNEGHSYKWHCNAYEVVFYDKLKDLEIARKSAKRAFETDNQTQLHLFKKLRTHAKFEILRMEVRLNKRQKMKSLFTTLGIKTDLTFKKLFKPAISKKILLHYLDMLERKRSTLLDYKHAHGKGLLPELIVNNPTLSLNRIMHIFGFAKALQEYSLRELKTMLPQKGWHRLLADAQHVKISKASSPLAAIREHIVKFKPAHAPKR